MKEQKNAMTDERTLIYIHNESGCIYLGWVVASSKIDPETGATATKNDDKFVKYVKQKARSGLVCVCVCVYVGATEN